MALIRKDTVRNNTAVFPEWIRIALVAPALIMAALGWLGTFQTQIGASYPLHIDPDGTARSFMDDSGEFVVAWSTWGVSHPPGYPLLGVIGNVWVRAGRLIGIPPLPSASGLSFGLALLSLGLLGLVVLRVDRYGFGATGAILLAAFGFRVWLYASVAEVYALGLAMAMGLLYLACAIGSHPSPPKVLAFGLLFGLAVGHHRTLVMLLPGLALLVWNARRLGWRVWMGAMGLALVSQVVFVYLPLAALAGSPWIYGRSPATWAGFLDAVSGLEYSGGLVLVRFRDMGTLMVERFGYLVEDMTAIPIIAGTAGAAAGIGIRSLPASRGISQSLLAWIDAAHQQLSQEQKIALAMVIHTAAFVCVPIPQFLVITTHLPIMITGLHLAVACGIGIAVIGRKWLPAGIMAALLAIAGSFGMYQANRAAVVELTDDTRGQQMIDAIQALDAEAPVVIESWGPRYSALAYGKYGSREIADIRLIDARGSLENIPAIDDTAVYTTRDFLYIAGLETWSRYFGDAAALSSAGDGIVRVSNGPEIGDAATGEGEIQIESARAWIEGDAVRLTIQWIAAQTPARDYSISVHVSEQEQIESAEDIIAQGDSAHPVYGFYPFSLWVKGERVQDDYRVEVPGGSVVRYVTVGLYTVEADGRFTNFLTRVIEIEREDD